MAQVKEKLASLVAKREKAFSRLQILYDLSKTLSKQNFHTFKARYEKMDELYNTFDNIQDEINVLSAKADPEDEVDTKASTASFDEMYYAVKALGQQYIKETEKLASNPTHAKLPDIAIPTFSGDIKTWANFHALFESLIHKNPSILNVEKLQFLRTYVKGSALAIIEHLPLTSDNYTIAYDALLARYQNKRVLASFYLSQITNFKTLSNDSLSGLSHFLDIFKTNFAALQALKLENEGEFVLLHIALQALDSQTRSKFEGKYTSADIPTFTNLMDFIQEQCKILELTQIQSSKSMSKPHMQTNTRPSTLGSSKKNILVSNTFKNKGSDTNSLCPVCNESHKIHQCPQFVTKTTSERHATIKSLKRCFNCLGNHLITSCTSTSRCKVCNRTSHHTLLHFSNRVTSSTPCSDTTDNSQKSTPSLSCKVSCDPGTSQTVLLGTAQVLIEDSMGDLQPIRLVIDPGSQVSCISNSCVQRLHLPRKHSSVQLSGIGNTPVAPSKGSVTCTLISNIDKDKQISTEAVVLPHISSNLPSCLISQKIKAKFWNLKLADPLFDQPSKIDFLLGADIYGHILADGLLQGDPSAISTIFGWVIFGKAQAETQNSNRTTFFVTSPNLETVLQRFWELEEVSNPRSENPEDIICETNFQNTTYRDSTGRYVVSYPLKETPPHLGSSRQSALKRFHRLECRLENNLPLKEQYHDFVSKYEELGHMSEAKHTSSYIIPHHCVTNDSSSSTKLRVVFDGSMKGSNCISLNDQLLKGPKLQQDISDIILNFRLKPVALCADIKMMYRQILIHPDQRQYQHIFWRDNLSSPVKEYELNTVTYGLTSSPFLAQRVLQQLVKDEGKNYPEAAETILNFTYVDDIVTSLNNENEALKLQSQLIKLLDAGGFSLRKWASNKRDLLQSLPTEYLQHPVLLDSENDHIMKVLGLQWEPHSDKFLYSVSVSSAPYTKRTILSHVARMFDPLGWLSPTIFLAKHLIQLLWKSSIGWDEELPHDLHCTWDKFIKQLPELGSLRIPRFGLQADCSSLTLVGFSDASEKGYGAVTYLISTGPNGDRSVILLKAKNKVAPLKCQSVPRLELCAALLLARLVNSMQDFLTRAKVTETYLFTDSTVVLSWLHTQPHLLKVFVANRVVETLEHTSLSYWHHIATNENPADFSSRGLYPSALLNSSMWWYGPQFLSQSANMWPINQQNLTLNEVPEMRKQTTNIVALSQSSNNLMKTINKFSSLVKLQCVMAYVLRFINNIKHLKEEQTVGPLTLKELQNSLLACVKLTQEEYFSQDIKLLKTQSEPTRALRSLTPFLDEDGFLRVGGRLRYANIPVSAKHPILLPKKCQLSTLICDFYHVNTLHGGPRVVQALIQKRFWIISLRSVLRQRIHLCIKCHKLSASPRPPLMSDLPPSRVSPVRAFLNVGLDMAGPFIVKESNRRNAKTYKSYLCLFVCMSTKALHLELTTDLSTSAFLAALDRFIGRRGLPSVIHSDLGSNFLGAANELKAVYIFFRSQKEDIFNNLAKREIKWQFNPPSAPNFGGLWEAGVKSVKYHLKRSIGLKNLTFEELTTVLVRIEAVLNSRPLCAVSNDPHDDINYLTPGHFLIGQNLLSAPEKNVLEIPQNRLNRWQLLKQTIQSFWKQWSREYLHSMIQRPKWTKVQKNLAEGDLVYVKGQTTSPLNWPLARVESIYPGNDGVVRVVKVHTSSGSLVRPINKLIPLPIE